MAYLFILGLLLFYTLIIHSNGPFRLGGWKLGQGFPNFKGQEFSAMHSHGRLLVRDFIKELSGCAFVSYVGSEVEVHTCGGLFRMLWSGGQIKPTFT
jgi:hypothetical protein